MWEVIYRLLFRGEPRTILVDSIIWAEAFFIFGGLFLLSYLVGNLDSLTKSQLSLLTSILLYLYLVYFFEKKIGVELTFFGHILYATPIVKDLISLIILMVVSE